MLKAESVKPGELKPWKKNPRLNEKAVDAVAKSIERFGFNVPILCDQALHIIAGHTRWKAAKKLRMKSVPVVRLGLQGPERHAFAIADNRTADIADWDMDCVSAELERLHKAGVDMSALRYSEAEVQALLVPEQDLSWESFDEEQRRDVEEDYALLPVKVRRRDKERFKKAIKKYAMRHNIKSADSGVSTGLVFAELLGVRTR